MAPIKAAVKVVEDLFKVFKDFFGGLLRRRLEDLTPTEAVHARRLHLEMHRQLGEVRGRLLHADNDDARNNTKERLLSDVHRRLEEHMGQRQLVARQLGLAELIEITSLKASITLGLDSRMLIEGKKSDTFPVPLPTGEKEIKFVLPLYPTPFSAKLTGSFNVATVLKFQFEGDFKALVHFVVSDLGVFFDLSTFAQKRADFREGDWTQTIRLEVLSEQCHAAYQSDLPKPHSLVGSMAC